MDIIKTLDDAKAAMGVDSDYKLAKALGVSTGRITELRNGGKPTVYIVTKLAVILGEDPLRKIAEFQAVNAKSKEQRGFWASFFSTAALWITLGVALPTYNTTSASAESAGSPAITHNQPLYELLSRLRRRVKVLEIWRYFTCNWHVKFS